MTVRSKAELREKIVADLPDNTDGDITEGVLREVLTDMVDSWPNAGGGGGVTPAEQPRTWAAWWLDSDGVPSVGEVLNDDHHGTNSVVLPDGPWSGPIRLYGLVPDDRWPWSGKCSTGRLTLGRKPVYHWGHGTDDERGLGDNCSSARFGHSAVAAPVRARQASNQPDERPNSASGELV